MNSTSTPNLFETAFSLLPDPAVITDINYNIVEANRSFLETFGLEDNSIKGFNFLDLTGIGKVEEKQILDLLKYGSAENSSIRFEARIQSRKKIITWAIVETRCFQYESRVMCLNMLTNVAVGKTRREEENTGNERKYSIDNARYLILSISPEGSIISANQKCLEIIGYSAKDLPDLHITDIIRDDQVPSFFTLIDRVKKGENFDYVETVFKARDGREIYLEGDLDGNFEEEGFLSVQAVFRDITHRKTVEETYSLLIRNFPVPIYIVKDDLIRFVNPAFLSMTEYSENELNNLEFARLVHPEDQPSVLSKYARLARISKPSVSEFRIIRKSGEVRWVMETVISIPFEGRRAGLGSVIDLTENRLVLDALHESKDRYQTLFNSASDAIYIADRNNRFIEVNDTACSLLGYSRNQLLKMSLDDIKHQTFLGSLAERIATRDQTGNFTIESETIASGGKLIPTESHGSIVDYDRQSAVLIMDRDITPRKMVEKMRRRHEARLESLIKLSQLKIDYSCSHAYFILEEILALTDSRLGYFYTSDTIQNKFDISAWSKGLLKSIDMKNRLNTIQPAPGSILHTACMEGNPVIVNELRSPDPFQNGYPPGLYELKRMLCVPLFIEGRLIAVASAANKESDYDQIDSDQITMLFESVWSFLERQKAEKEKFESERRYRQLIEQSRDAIFVIDAEGHIQITNPAACKMFGYDNNEMGYLNFSATYIPEKQEEFHNSLNDVSSTEPERFERQALRRNGEIFPVEVSVTPLAQGLFQEVIRDITVRKKMELEIQESERKYRLLVENQTDLLAEISPQGELLFANPAYCKLIGRTKEELFGLQVKSLIHPDDWEQALKDLRPVFEPPHTAYSESRFTTKEGWRWIAWTDNAVLDASGKVVALTCLGRDITESKLAKEELEKANERLRELDKLKDNFLSTVSHELRTPLTSIKSFAEILLNYEEDRETQKEFLGIINEESDRLTRLINDFLDLSKIQAGGMRWQTVELSVAEVINSVVNSSRPLIESARIDLLTYLETDLPSVLCDKDRLTQVVTNLVGNAVKFTPENGKVTIRAWNDLDEDDGRSMVFVSISDTGIGIDSANHQKIFEKFGQVGDVLKDRPKGTGLGLPICKKIIENYKGKIWVQSTLGKGSTFFFSLPAGSSRKVESRPEENRLRSNKLGDF